MQFGEGELRGSVDSHEKVEPSLLGSDLGNIDVKIADRVFPERLSYRLVAFDFRQAADAMALVAMMKLRARKMRDGSLQGIKAIVERQQRVLAEGHCNGLLLDGQDGRAGLLRPHGRIMDEGPLPPLGDRLCIDAVTFG